MTRLPASVALLLLSLVFGAEPGRAGDREATSLVDAVESKNWAAVAKQLQHDADVQQVQPDGMTALHWAAFHGHEATVGLLIEAKCDVNAKTRYEVTPLSIACEAGYASIVKRLLAAGADANQTLPGGVTPLMLAARTGSANAVGHLLAHEANLDAKERRGQTALMWAAAAGNVGAVDVLIKAGADPNASVSSGFTPLLFAAREGNSVVVQRLLAAGVDVNAVMEPKGGGGRTPRKGTSALLMAVESGHFELAMELVAAGADPNDQRSGYGPLHVLTWVRKPDRGENPQGDPPPRGSGKLTDLQFVEAIVEAGADVNLQLKNGKGGRAHLNHRGATPFLLAGKTADLPYLKLLLQLGAKPQRPNADGCTALMAAAGIGVRAVGEEAGTEPEVLETLAFLIEQGLDVNTVDRNKETAMHGAAYRNFPRVVEFLAAHGADPAEWNHKNASGWTPVMIAQGHRPGSFKPSPETVAALRAAMDRRSTK